MHNPTNQIVKSVMHNFGVPNGFHLMFWTFIKLNRRLRRNITTWNRVWSIRFQDWYIKCWMKKHTRRDIKMKNNAIDLVSDYIWTETSPTCCKTWWYLHYILNSYMISNSKFGSFRWWVKTWKFINFLWVAWALCKWWEWPTWISLRRRGQSSTSGVLDSRALSNGARHE